MAIIARLLELVELLILVRAILSWIDPNPNTPFSRLICSLTDPILAPFRSFTRFGPVDFSPMIAIILIELIRQML